MNAKSNVILQVNVHQRNTHSKFKYTKMKTHWSMSPKSWVSKTKIDCNGENGMNDYGDKQMDIVNNTI